MMLLVSFAFDHADHGDSALWTGTLWTYMKLASLCDRQAEEANFKSAIWVLTKLAL
jgi:hypothetical protein